MAWIYFLRRVLGYRRVNSLGDLWLSQQTARRWGVSIEYFGALTLLGVVALIWICR